jgi:hypothetical protein
MLYAQCEDDFKRVEMNYIENWDVSLKRTIGFYNDLEIRLLIDVDEAKADYKKTPWLKTIK